MRTLTANGHMVMGLISGRALVTRYCGGKSDIGLCASRTALRFAQGGGSRERRWHPCARIAPPNLRRVRAPEVVSQDRLNDQAGLALPRAEGPQLQLGLSHGFGLL